jgi:hypothetical protein
LAKYFFDYFIVNPKVIKQWRWLSLMFSWRAMWYGCQHIGSGLWNSLVRILAAQVIKKCYSMLILVLPFYFLLLNLVTSKQTSLSAGKSLYTGRVSTACAVVNLLKKWLFVQRQYFVLFLKQLSPQSTAHVVPSPPPCIENSLLSEEASMFWIGS